MAKVDIKLNIAGLQALRNSAEMQDAMLTYGNAAVNRLGDGYDTDVQPGKSRAVCMVKAQSNQAKIEASEYDSILKAVMMGD